MATPPTDVAVYGSDNEEDPDEDDYYEEDHNDDVPDEDDEDVEVDDDSISSADPLPPSSDEVTVAVSGLPSTPEPKRTNESSSSMALTLMTERKPLPLPADESRKLFQRLWTDEDEIELLQGFLDYTVQRGYNNSSSHHHDTTPFYDQIKSKLQLDFNKNQLVEKLRRLKKKYRNVLSKLNSGKDYVFKTPHDQTTFEISKKIWGGAGTIRAVSGGGELDEDEGNPSLLNLNFNDNSSIMLTDDNVNNNSNYSHKAVRPRKRAKASVKVEEKHQNTLIDQSPAPQVAATTTPMGFIPNLIEDTVRSCLSPLFKELLNNAMSRGGGMLSSGTLNSMMMMPLGIGDLSLNFARGGDVDDKWRKQQILELEVYSKRLELIQNQIKSQLEELRLMGS